MVEGWRRGGWGAPGPPGALGAAQREVQAGAGLDAGAHGARLGVGGADAHGQVVVGVPAWAARLVTAVSTGMPSPRERCIYGERFVPQLQ